MSTSARKVSVGVDACRHVPSRFSNCSEVRAATGLSDAEAYDELVSLVVEGIRT